MLMSPLSPNENRNFFDKLKNPPLGSGGFFLLFPDSTERI